MEGLIVLAVVIGALMSFGVAALAFGTDSRDSFVQGRAILS
jgi:hypothetical protein